MSSYKKCAASGMRFQIYDNPDGFYKLVKQEDSDTWFDITFNGEIFGAAGFRYKHLMIEKKINHLYFKIEIALSDLNFVP